MEIKLKQFVIVPKDPVMSAGKIASQVAHATFMALKNQRGDHLNRTDCKPEMSSTIIDEWEENGMCVIVLECVDTIQLLGIAKYLEQWKIPHHLYIDEGMTEIPMGTPTALATGVMPLKQHWMLSQLQLFR